MRLGRVYDAPQPDEGVRVLVDRLWPRGVRKEDPRVGQWCKDVAPSTELRQWYGHRPERAAEFAHRYRAELAEPQAAQALSELRALAHDGPVTLVTATKDVNLSHLPVLAEVLG
jgi:uncharacterized protein YeaO (DUF488 family)